MVSGEKSMICIMLFCLQKSQNIIIKIIANIFRSSQEVNERQFRSYLDDNQRKNIAIEGYQHISKQATISNELSSRLFGGITYIQSKSSDFTESLNEGFKIEQNMLIQNDLDSQLKKNINDFINSKDIQRKNDLKQRWQMDKENMFNEANESNTTDESEFYLLKEKNRMIESLGRQLVDQRSEKERLNRRVIELETTIQKLRDTLKIQESLLVKEQAIQEKERECHQNQLEMEQLASELKTESQRLINQRQQFQKDLFEYSQKSLVLKNEQEKMNNDLSKFNIEQNKLIQEELRIKERENQVTSKEQLILEREKFLQNGEHYLKEKEIVLFELIERLGQHDDHLQLFSKQQEQQCDKIDSLQNNLYSQLAYNEDLELRTQGLRLNQTSFQKNIDLQLQSCIHQTQKNLQKEAILSAHEKTLKNTISIDESHSDRLSRSLDKPIPILDHQNRQKNKKTTISIKNNKQLKQPDKIKQMNTILKEYETSSTDFVKEKQQQSKENIFSSLNQQEPSKNVNNKRTFKIPEKLDKVIIQPHETVPVLNILPKSEFCSSQEYQFECNFQKEKAIFQGIYQNKGNLSSNSSYADHIEELQTELSSESQILKNQINSQVDNTQYKFQKSSQNIQDWQLDLTFPNQHNQKFKLNQQQSQDQDMSIVKHFNYSQKTENNNTLIPLENENYSIKQHKENKQNMYSLLEHYQTLQNQLQGNNSRNQSFKSISTLSNHHNQQIDNFTLEVNHNITNKHNQPTFLQMLQPEIIQDDNLLSNRDYFQIDE